MELVLEASVPPWELSLRRPAVSSLALGGDDNGDNRLIEIPPAADCVRRMGDDEEGDIEDDFDPASDGVGSYLDFVYRRFMKEMLGGGESLSSRKSTQGTCAADSSACNIHGGGEERDGKDNDGANGGTDEGIGHGHDPESTWLHCVDVRDLGCQSACHTPAVKALWDKLLTPEEASELLVL